MILVAKFVVTGDRWRLCLYFTSQTLFRYFKGKAGMMEDRFYIGLQAVNNEQLILVNNRLSLLHEDRN